MDEICQYFALCTNRADGYVKHPILGNVPCCERCARIMEIKLETGA